MISLELHHNHCYCTWESDSFEFYHLSDACSYLVHDRWMSTAYQNGWWDGKKCLLEVIGDKKCRFPSGIFHRVYQKLWDIPGLLMDISNKMVYPKVDFHLPDMIYDPRGYQLESAQMMLEKKRGICNLPTGTGKTNVMALLAHICNLPTLWLTHEGSLGRQSQRRLAESAHTPKTVGFFGNQVNNIQRWTVGLVPAIHYHLDSPLVQNWLSQIRVLFLDECHRGGGDTWTEVANACPAAYRWGFSATPFERSDKSVMELIGICGELVYSKTPEELKNYLSKPIIEFIHLPAEPQIIAASWPDIYERGIVNNEFRNACCVDRSMLSVRDGSPCLLYVSYVEHGIILSNMLSSEIGSDGLHKFISGDTPQKIRDECYSKLQRGDIRVLIATDGVASEGQDIKTVKRIVMGGGKKSSIIIKQRTGRGMRPEVTDCEEGVWAGTLFVHDFIDNSHPKLRTHSLERKSIYAEIGSEFVDTRIS